MTTAIDTNVLVALWNSDPRIHTSAKLSLDSAQQHGALIISGIVYAELLGQPGRSEKMLDDFFRATSIRIDWEITEKITRAAGHAFQGYVARRSSGKSDLPRRLIADFLIGAHAAIHHHRLLTLDLRLYKAAFPRLEITAV